MYTPLVERLLRLKHTLLVYNLLGKLYHLPQKANDLPHIAAAVSGVEP
jgi:hypothetical protein